MPSMAKIQRFVIKEYKASIAPKTAPTPTKPKNITIESIILLWL